MYTSKSQSIFHSNAHKSSIISQINHSKIKEPLLEFNQLQNHPDHSYHSFIYGLKDDCFQQPLSKQDKIFINLIGKMEAQMKIFSPESRALFCWNLLVQISILYMLLMIPVSIFFTRAVYAFETQTGAGLAMNILATSVLCFNMLVQMNTSYTSNGKIVRNRSKIIKRYMKCPFWIDLITNISLLLYLCANSYEMRFIRAIFYLKVKSLFQIDSMNLQCLSIQKHWIILYRLARMIAFLWVLVTWAACIFFAIDFHFYLEQGLYYELGQLWLMSSQATQTIELVTSFPWYVWYEYALYWSVQTSTTIGYGDLTSRNPEQFIYNNFVMLLMTVLFAYFLNAVWEIINDISAGPAQYNHEWQTLKTHIQILKLPFQTKLKIVNYSRSMIEYNSEKQVQQMIIQNLSKSLQEDFYYETRIAFYKGDRFLNAMLKQVGDFHPFWRQLAQHIEQCCYGEEDLIYCKGQYDPSLYQMKRGLAQMHLQGSEICQYIKAGEVFGTDEFFQRSLRKFDTESISFCIIWKLQQKDLKGCMKVYPSLYLKFCEFSYYLNIEKESKAINIFYCWHCKNDHHNIEKCPLLCFQKQNNITLNLIILFLQAVYISQRKKHNRSAIKSKKVLQKYPTTVQEILIDKVCSFESYLPYHNI